MDAELKGLRIDKEQRRQPGRKARTGIWIAALLILLALAGAWRIFSGGAGAGPEVAVERVAAAGGNAAPDVVLNATGYIVAAHTIQVASKVVGKVNWIGVEKGDRVEAGQVLVRLEDDEYQAQLQQAKGQLATLQARLEEATNGSRPEEIAQALANLNSAKADLENARVSLERSKNLLGEALASRQSIDDAQARYDGAAAKVNALDHAYDLVKLGPRQEEIDALRGQVEQAQGAVALRRDQP